MSNPALVALRLLLLLAVLQAGPAGALLSTQRPIDGAQDHARNVDLAETKAQAACAGHIDLIKGTGGELASDYRCTRATLHLCRVTDDTAPAVKFAILLDGEFGPETYDPEQLLVLSTVRWEAKWPKSLSIGVMPFWGFGPHQDVYDQWGDGGGKIDLVYLGAAKARSTITIVHFRKPPAGDTIVFKGHCSVWTGASAIRRFRELKE
ncbi:MAG: hypothetical protein ABIS51_20750 [Sphingomonas sp.]